MYVSRKIKKYNTSLEVSIIDIEVFVDQIIEVNEKIIKIKYGKVKISIDNLNFLKTNLAYIMKIKIKNGNRSQVIR